VADEVLRPRRSRAGRSGALAGRGPGPRQSGSRRPRHRSPGKSIGPFGSEYDPARERRAGGKTPPGTAAATGTKGKNGATTEATRAQDEDAGTDAGGGASPGGHAVRTRGQAIWRWGGPAWRPRRHRRNGVGPPPGNGGGNCGGEVSRRGSGAPPLNVFRAPPAMARLAGTGPGVYPATPGAQGRLHRSRSMPF
jgi:hypothetical protein